MNTPDLPDRPDDLRDRTGFHHLKPPYSKFTVLGVFLVIAVLIFTGWTPTIPRRLKLAIYTFIPAALLGYPAATRIVDWLYRPDSTYLVDYDAQDDELAVWKIPASSWRELDVTEGELYSLHAASPAWEGRNFDPESLEVEGTWRGSATDLELVESREHINEIRNDLEDLAKEGLTIRVKQSSIVRGAVRDICQAFIADFEDETIYDGSQLEDKVDKAISHWQSETEQQQEELDETKDDKSLSEPNIANFGESVKPENFNNGN